MLLERRGAVVGPFGLRAGGLCGGERLVLERGKA